MYLGRENGVKKTRITKPVLLSEGFPGNYGWKELWPLVNEARFADDLLDQGYDLILVGYDDGTRRIEDNAHIYKAAVKYAIARKLPAETLACGGASMGGLIARYALCSLERESYAHQADVYFSIDTPHFGANIAPSAQAFIQLFSVSPCSGDAKKYAAQMASMAAQQMLLAWIPPARAWPGTFPIASEERGKFVAALRSVGWMPTVRRSIGIANGRGDGFGNGVPEKVRTLNFNLSVCHWADLYATARTGGGTIATMKNTDYKDAVVTWTTTGAAGVDGAPGGTRGTWAQIYVSAQRMTLYHPLHCFVPTVSACALVDGPDYYVSGVETRRSDLTAVKVAPDNIGHVKLTPELSKFLLATIVRKTAAPA